MTDNEMSQKCETLARWAGWIFEGGKWWSPPNKKGRQYHATKVPDYFHDMNACLRNFMPKLRERKINGILFVTDEAILTTDCHLMDRPRNTVAVDTGKNWPDALANACYKLAKEEK